MQMAVDTLGNRLAWPVIAAHEQERAQVGRLAKQVQDVTGESVEVAFVDQGYKASNPPKLPRPLSSNSKS